MTRWDRRRADSDGQEDDLISDDGAGDASRNGFVSRNTDLQAGTATIDDAATTDQSDSSQVKPVYTSQIAALFILVNVTIGTGLLAMPFAMQSAGIVASMLVQLVFLILIVITCIMCVEMTIKSESRSYHEIIQKLCHPYVFSLTQGTIVVFTFAIAVAFIVIIGDQADRIFSTLYGPTFCTTWYLHRRFIMTFSTLIGIKPLCSARTVDFLKYASFLGVLTLGFIFFVVAKEFHEIPKIPSDVNYFPKSWFDVAGILPVFALGYQVHLSLVPVVATVRRQDKSKAFVTSSVAMIICMIVYSLISILAVLTFGSTIEVDLTENFKGKTWFPTLGTIAIVGLKCILTLPAAYLPARLGLIDMLTNNFKIFAGLSEPVKRIGVTLVFLDGALLLAILVPDILVVVNLIGCVAVSFVFTLPGLAYISLVRQNRREKQQANGMAEDEPLHYTAKDYMKLYSSYFMIIFGLVITGVVLYKSIDEMINNKPRQPLCRP